MTADKLNLGEIAYNLLRSALLDGSVLPPSNDKPYSGLLPEIKNIWETFGWNLVAVHAEVQLDILDRDGIDPTPRELSLDAALDAAEDKIRQYREKLARADEILTDARLEVRTLQQVVKRLSKV